MAKASPAFTNFTAGELSPRLDGRTDLGKYFNGCKTLQNFLVHPHGGATRRPGTEFISEVKDSTKNVRLIPFEFNVEQAYILEFGDEVFRIYKDGGVVVDGGGSPVEVTTPYAHTDLAGLKFAQSADIMYMVHPNYPPQQITRTDHDAWTIEAVDFRRGPLLDPGFTGATLTANAATTLSDINYSSLSGTFAACETILGGTSGATATIITDDGVDDMVVAQVNGTFQTSETITGETSGATATLDSITNDGDITITASENTFVSTDVGRIIKIHHGYAQVTAFNSATSVDATVLENEDLREELMPSMTSENLSFHEGDPDATGLAHNDFIQDSDGTFLEEGFEVGMRVKISGSDNMTITDCDANGTRIRVTTDVKHGLNDGDRVTLFGVTGVTVSSPSGYVINREWIVEKINNKNFDLLDPLTDDKATGSGADTSGNGVVINANNLDSALIVQLTEDTMTLSTSADVVSQDKGPLITICGILEADDEFQLGAFSETTGYPACVSFFEQRLTFANTLASPQTLFFSVAGDYTNFTQGIDDDDALTYTIGSNQVNVIRYLTASRVLLVGTSGGEFALRAGSVDAPITPTNAQIKRQANYGSADIQPVTTGNVALFVQRAKRKMRELVYDFNTDSYVAPDMTLLAEHITEGLIKEIAFQQEPDNIVWCVLENGKLVGMTYRREEEVIAWHEHLIGGTSSTQSYGFVESVASIPGPSDEDEVYIAVKRTIDGSEVRYVERIKPIDFGTDVENAFFVDSGLTYTGVAATTITGLDHLEGETIKVLANGSVHPDVTVSSGSVTLNRETTKAHFGLPYTSTLQTMRSDAGGTEGTSQGKTKRIRDVTLRIYRSVGAKIGPNETDLELIPFRDSSMPMNAPVPLYTGDKDIEFPSGYETDGFVVVKQDQPLPLTILAIFPRLQTFDR